MSAQVNMASLVLYCSSSAGSDESSNGFMHIHSSWKVVAVYMQHVLSEFRITQFQEAFAVVLLIAATTDMKCRYGDDISVPCWVIACHVVHSVGHHL